MSRNSFSLRLAVATLTLAVGISSTAGAQAAKKPAAAQPSAPATLPPAPVAADATVPVKTIVAAAKARMTPIYATAGAVKPFTTVDNRKNFSGRHVFVVTNQTVAGWYEVKVAMRPNGKTGWVKASDVTLFQHDYAVVVSLSQHTLTAYKGGKEFMRETVAVGASQWPTPTGSFFIRELARPSNPRGAYGPWAFGLSAYSNVFTKFGRGDGQIGIHGTNQPKALGTSVSHGCIRIRNEAVTKLAQTLPQGVPVTILP